MLGFESVEKHTHYVPKLLPLEVKFRNNQILNIKPEENLLLGDKSLRHSYEYLILATGKETDYSNVEGNDLFT